MGIYVWGTGCGASELAAKGLPEAAVTAYVDSFFGGGTFLGKPVLRPEAVPAEDCGLLIVTSRDSQAIAGRCRELGIPEDRILFLKNHCTLWDRNCLCPQARELLEEAVWRRLLPRQRIVSTPAQLADSALSQGDLAGDYVRMASLELLCRRLTRVPGAAAELGVYRGGFARCVNALLPERRLWLFDSFAGFRPEEGAAPAFQAAHRNTSPEQVRGQLPHPEQAVFRVGFFPESAEGVEDRFCLVSLDVDFLESTLAGLRWFWPRLEPGGYLLLHDWGNPGLDGVAEAFEQWQRELGQRIPAVPLPDLCGTLVLCKV